jgi:hypothetical protein
MERAADGNNGFLGRTFGSGLNINIDAAKLKQFGNMARDPDRMARAVQAVEGAQLATQGADASLAAYTQAKANYDNILRIATERGIPNPQNHPQVRRAAEILAQADAATRVNSGDLADVAEFYRPQTDNRPMPQRRAPPQSQARPSTTTPTRFVRPYNPQLRGVGRD